MPPRARPLLARVWENIDQDTTPDGCWLWTRPVNDSGYAQISSPEHGTIRVARWLLSQRIGRALTRSEVARHTCDVPRCCRPTHLIVGTRKDNARDAAERHRLPGNRKSRGHVPRQRLSDAQVVAIREQYALGRSSFAVADAFGISASHVRNLVTGRYRPTAGGPLTRRITDDTEERKAA